MAKKYIAPDIKVTGFDTEDVLNTSVITTDLPKTFEGAVGLEEQTIDIFSE